MFVEPFRSLVPLEAKIPRMQVAKQAMSRVSAASDYTFRAWRFDAGNL
jgi:hypothetical protein